MKKPLNFLMGSVFLVLSACTTFTGPGGVVGTILNDKRSVEMINLDNKIRKELGDKIAQTPELKNSHIIVSSYERIVFLGGQTPSASYRVLVERLAQKVKGVKRIYNEITIGEPSSLKQRAKDAWITATAKGYMVAREGLKSGSVKVITENGSVFLIGRTSHDQANLAVDVTRRIDGVRRVVKIFQYTD